MLKQQKRAERSLGVVTEAVMKLFRQRCISLISKILSKSVDLIIFNFIGFSSDGVLELNDVANKIEVPKRRLYDIINVLEGVRADSIPPPVFIIPAILYKNDM